MEFIAIEYYINFRAFLLQIIETRAKVVLTAALTPCCATGLCAGDLRFGFC